MSSRTHSMQNGNDPIAQLRAYYPLPDAIIILQILRPLLNDAGKASLPFLESELAANPNAARLSISTLGSSRSGRSLASPLFERSNSSMAFSDVSSIASGFIPDNESLSGAAPPSLGPSGQRKYKSTQAHRVAKQAQKAAAASAASSPILSPRKPSFECPFCWELKIPTSISRKADLKRHFKQFHQNNAQWICQERGCSKAFDWKSAFEAHLKENHGNTQHPSDSHQVKLCPQVVFACGFSNCRLVFEAASDDDAEKKAQEYFNHVANHFDDNLTHRNWSYSVRIRNLMRQPAVESHWKDRKKAAQDPMWQPHTSSVVRKILETRHFTDIPLLVQWVVMLGSWAYNQPHSPLPKLPADLRLPVKDNCSLVLEGHGPSLLRRESHRLLALDHAAPPPKELPEIDPAPTPAEPDPEPEVHPKPDPDMEPEYAVPPQQPPTTQQPQPPPDQQHQQQQHQPMTLADFDPDPSSYLAFQQHHQHLMHQLDAQPHASTTSAAVTAPTFVDSQPITHWLGMTEPRQGIPLQPHLDAIISYPHHPHQGNHHNMMATDYRPVTPAHQLLGQDVFASMMPPQANSMAPVDLEMNDCPFESDVNNCF
ncbi:hypothetical protein QBC34DRAFT_471318 [Podospora aff. communis PSN243]|uniref:C2H2-type domain-containing protein n=1 Tax=Podospora aff. communis PSN243 TaxID=3040156 RepID=A0AAV9H241_9PEZI|nr:hypothetical protein QBC34DRAFT_471318 [Podospora aff. communis PSN243]